MKKVNTNKLNKITKLAILFIPLIILVANSFYVESHNVSSDTFSIFLLLVYPIIIVFIVVLVAYKSGSFSKVNNKVMVFFRLTALSLASYFVWIFIWIFVFQEVLEQILY